MLARCVVGLAASLSAADLAVDVTVRFQPASTVQLVSATSEDADADGRIDQVRLLLSGPVDVLDPGGAADALLCLLPEVGWSFANSSYAATSVTAVVLPLATPLPGPDTARTTTLAYDAGAIAELTDPGGVPELAPGLVAPAVDGARPLSTLASSASDVVATTTWTVLAYFSEPVADLAAGGLDVVNASVTDLVRTGSASFAVTLTPLAPGAMSVRVPDAAVADAAGNPCRASTTLQRIWFPATAGYAFAVTSATLAGTARGSRVVHVDDAAVPAGDGTWLAQSDLPGPDPKRRTVVVELRMPLASESSIRRTVVLDVGVEPAGGGG